MTPNAAAMGNVCETTSIATVAVNAEITQSQTRPAAVTLSIPARLSSSSVLRIQDDARFSRGAESVKDRQIRSNPVPKNRPIAAPTSGFRQRSRHDPPTDTACVVAPLSKQSVDVDTARGEAVHARRHPLRSHQPRALTGEDRLGLD